MYTLALLLSFFAVALSNPPPKGGIVVSVDDGKKGLSVGGEDRMRFDLGEHFLPLSRAAKAVGDLDVLRRRLAGVKNTAHGPNSIVVDAVAGEKELVPPSFPQPIHLIDGEWRDWSSWSACQNGQRTRTRVCSSRHVAWKVECIGESKEVAACFDTQKKTPTASDPWTIEKEITRKEISRA